MHIYHTLLCGRDGYCECVFWWQKGVKRVVFIVLRLRQTEAERSEWWQWISISATHSERDKRDVNIGHFVWPFNKFRASPNQSPFPIYAHFCFFFFTRFLTSDSSLLKIFSILWVRVNSINKVFDNWINQHLEGENRMEWKLMKKNNFRIFFNSLLWEF